MAHSGSQPTAGGCCGLQELTESRVARQTDEHVQQSECRAVARGALLRALDVLECPRFVAWREWNSLLDCRHDRTAEGLEPPEDSNRPSSGGLLGLHEPASGSLSRPSAGAPNWLGCSGGRGRPAAELKLMRRAAGPVGASRRLLTGRGMAGKARPARGKAGAAPVLAWVGGAR